MLRVSLFRASRQQLRKPYSSNYLRIDSIKCAWFATSTDKDSNDEPTTPTTKRRRWKDNRWAKLIKSDLSALVCVTSAGGYILTGGSLFDLKTFLGVVTGTMLSAASAAAFNQLKEVKYDQIMARTRLRPLVTGDITIPQAKLFGWVTGGLGVGLLALTTTPTTSALSLLTILTYTHVYTPLKRVTRFNTEVGALVGAIPPVMGWTAAMGSSGVFQPEALFLAATLYAWQMHHFMTIAWSSRADYERAEFVMQSLNDPTGIKTARKGMFWAGSMLVLPFCSTMLEFTNPMFILTGSAINLYLLRDYYRFYRNRTSKEARRARIAGIIQLLLFFAAMIFHLENKGKIQGFQQLSQLRQTGLHWCVYHYHQAMDAAHWCVYLFGGKKPEKKVANQPEEVGAIEAVDDAVTEKVATAVTEPLTLTLTPSQPSQPSELSGSS